MKVLALAQLAQESLRKRCARRRSPNRIEDGRHRQPEFQAALFVMPLGDDVEKVAMRQEKSAGTVAITQTRSDQRKIAAKKKTTNGFHGERAALVGKCRPIWSQVRSS